MSDKQEKVEKAIGIIGAIIGIIKIIFGLKKDRDSCGKPSDKA
jgi:flagellar motor component MotA